jgi:acetyl esterase/lipase
VTTLLRVPRLARFAAAALPAAALLAFAGGAPAAVTEKLGVRYGSAVDFDGEREGLRLDLYRPPARSRPRPAIIWVHGGAFISGNPRYMTPYARAFAKRGYVSATISYRLADDGELSRVGFPAAIRAAQHDAQAAVRWFRRHAAALGLDTRRIYIAGHSAGAITALEVAVSGGDPGRSGNPGYSSRVDAAIGIAGLVLDHDQLDRRDAPMLLFHGTADDTVPYGGSTSLRAAARPVGLSCRLVTFPGGDHLVAYSKLDVIVRRSASWLRRRW